MVPDCSPRRSVRPRLATQWLRVRPPAPPARPGSNPSMNSAPEARATSCEWEQIRNELCYDVGTMAALLEHTLLEAHDPSSGRYDAVRVGHSLGLSAAEMALVVGWTPRGVRK